MLFFEKITILKSACSSGENLMKKPKLIIKDIMNFEFSLYNYNLRIVLRYSFSIINLE